MFYVKNVPNWERVLLVPSTALRFGVTFGKRQAIRPRQKIIGVPQKRKTNLIAACV